VLLAWWGALDFPSFRLIVGGAPLIAVIALWPRFDRLDRDATVLSRATAPTLFQLVDRVAATVGAPAPAVIAVDGRLAADAGRQGLRSRRTLLLGMPLWLALGEAQRAALLAHLLGHFVDRDPRRGALGPVEYSLARAVMVLQPTRSRLLGPMRDPNIIAARVGSDRGVSPRPEGLLVVASELIWTPIANVLGSGIMMVRLALVAAAQPISYRGAYFADALGARVGGTAAMTGVIHLLTRGEGLLTLWGANTGIDVPGRSYVIVWCRGRRVESARWRSVWRPAGCLRVVWARRTRDSGVEGALWPARGGDRPLWCRLNDRSMNRAPDQVRDHPRGSPQHQPPAGATSDHRSRDQHAVTSWQVTAVAL
jgi:hypothetical protein